MRVSVVISTYNRAPSLAHALDALRLQTYDDFEVVVVDGPSTDGTAELLRRWEGRVRACSTPERNLSRSRNVGIAAAAGDVVAFLDDDAVPEPRWLEQLVAAYDAPDVGGAGGVVLDHTGVTVQYRFSVCSRIGLTDFDQEPPLDRFLGPGADPYVYLQGTNASFRREALVRIGGFDEEIEYNYDESEVCARVVDAGLRLVALDGARVHHKFLASHMRREQGFFTDPYLPVKNRAYFALANGRATYGAEAVLRSLVEYLDVLRAWARSCAADGRMTPEEADHFVARMEAGFDLGVERGMRAQRRSRELPPPEPGAFLPFDVLRPPDGRRLRVCLESLDFPPLLTAGIARYTADLARGLAARGHDVHVVTRAEGQQRTDLEDGVWVHRHPEGPRHVPALDPHPLRNGLAHCAAMHRAVDRLQRDEPFDVVSGNLWIAEPLLSTADPRSVVALVCSTPMRVVAATQPASAAAGMTPWQVRLEDLALARAQHLQPVSRANLELLREQVPAAAAAPATVTWHGLVDRAPAVARRRGDDGVVEVLFVGRLEPRKGVDVLLEAGIALLQDRPEARLRLVGPDTGAATGGTTYAAWLDERLGAGSPLRERIVLDGAVDDEAVLQAFADCDVFCAPSRYESFGLVLLEAMMLARPVISCRAGGIPEVVLDGETGLLVPPGDAAALHDALDRLVRDRALRARLGAAGRARFEAEFDEDAAARRTEALYLDLAEQAARRRAAVAGDLDEAAEAAVRDGLVGVLHELEIDAAVVERAADELLARHAFPHDRLKGYLDVVDADDETFLRGLYASVLRRDIDDLGLGASVERLRAGALRADLLREVVVSDEARALGVDPAFVAHVPPARPLEVQRIVQDALWRDDATFAQRIGRLAGGPEGAERRAEAIAARLDAGAARAAVLGELAADPAVRERLGDAAGVLGEGGLLTQDALRTALADLDGGGDAPFVRGAYRLLLGRDPEPGGAAPNLRALRAGRPRIVVLREIAGSAEAQRRGIDPAVVEAQARAVPALLRDPVVRRLRRRLRSAVPR